MFSATAIAAVAAASPAFTACGSNAPSSQSPAESQGTVRANLIAVGPNNNQYELPQNVFFELTAVAPADAGAQQPNDLFFTPGLMVQNFSVPPGNYTGVLMGGPPWTLTDDTTNQTSNAVLLDSEPYNITVTSGQTTALAFHFALAGVGNVTFGTGTLDTSLSVAGADAGTPTTGNFAAAALDIQGTQDPGKGNPALDNLVNSSSPATFSLPDQDFQILSPGFQAGVDDVCANISVGPLKPISETVPDAGATGAVDLFDEAAGPGATGILCVYDSNGPTTNTVILQFARTGVATSGTVKNAIGAENAQFVSSIIGSATTSLYDGKTAQLSQLATAMTMTVVQTSIFFNPGGPDEVDAFGVGAGQTLTLQLTP
jgi:hypothetical protein